MSCFFQKVNLLKPCPLSFTKYVDCRILRVHGNHECPGKSWGFNLPEPSGVARNGPSRVRPDSSKIKLTFYNSSCFQVATWLVVAILARTGTARTGTVLCQQLVQLNASRFHARSANVRTQNGHTKDRD